MTYMSPTQLRREMQEMEALMGLISADYKWACNVGYQRSNSQAEKVKGSGISDPTGETVVSGFHGRARSLTRQAAKDVRKARKALEAAQSKLELVFREDGTQPEATDQSLVSPISREEYQEALNFKAKREALGIGYGEG